MRGFGAGHINGFGGKPLKMASLNEAATEPVSESPQDCVVRELEEETGISGKQVRDRLRWHGHLLIHAQDKESTSNFANEHALLSVFSVRLPKATLETAERQTDADRLRLNSLAEPIITRFRAEINFDGSSTVHLPPAPHSLLALPQLDFPTIARQRLIKRWSLSLTLSNATKIQ
ncbi:hypothetical protein OC845_001650 [Tilletia horrida]|nr:hypothetical protein OC845_001650 [Tilletia horrida]